MVDPARNPGDNEPLTAAGGVETADHWMKAIRERAEQSQFGIPTILPSGRGILSDLLRLRGLILRLERDRAAAERAMQAMMEVGSRADAEIVRLRTALGPFARHFNLNDCEVRGDDDALEVPISDLRRAAYALEQGAGRNG